MNLVISIVNYNSEIQLIKLLYNIPRNNDVLICIIDHSEEISTPIKINKILHDLGHVNFKIIKKENKGYGYGHNISINIAYELKAGILILNPDIELPERFIEDHLVNLKKNDCAYMFKTEMPLMTYTGIKLDGMQTKYMCDTKEILQITDYLAGSCMYLPDDIIKRKIFFDEKIFLYWEEVDLSLRLKIMGVNLWCYTGCSIKRAENSINAKIKSIYYLSHNSIYIKKKYKINLLYFIIYILNLFNYSTILSAKTKKIEPVILFFRGLKNG